jgi:hypothetical protein
MTRVHEARFRFFFLLNTITKNCPRRLHNHATGVYEVILHQLAKGDFPLFTQLGHEGYEAFSINGRKEIQKEIFLFPQNWV